MTILLTIAGAFFIVLLQKILYARRWSQGLHAAVTFQEHPAVEGETAILTETIINRKWLPLITLQVKFSVSKHLRFQQKENTVSTDRNYRNDIFSISGYEKITRTLPFVCNRRGYYQIKEIDLISFDLFFDDKQLLEAPQDTALYVYPSAVSPAAFDVPFCKLMGTVLSRRSTYEDPFEFRGIRPYDIHDPVKDINWKASARTGGLKVNQHNYTASQKVTILLNLYSDSNWKYEKLYEESIRIAAAFSNGCIAKGIPVSLISNGTDCISREPVHIHSGSGESHRITILKSLARIDERTDADEFAPFIIRELESADPSSVYVLISRIQTQNLLHSYSSLCAVSPGSLWIVPLHPDMNLRNDLCPNAEIIKWEVPYGG